MMQRIVPLLILALAWGPLAAFAEDSREARLDDLFGALAEAPDEPSAYLIEHEIWMLWTHSGDADADAQMGEAMRRRSNYDLRGALEVLDRLIESEPDWAEAWNQRATVYFHLGELENSLQDVAEALRLEPRHFGALAGRGVIRLQQGRPALAYQNILEAMAIHPWIRERSMLPMLDQSFGKVPES